MTKSSGLGQGLYIGGNDLSGDIGSLSRVHGGPALLDVTGIDKSAHERIGGLIDAGVGFESWFNASGSHPVLSALPTADVLVMYVHASSLGAPVACLVAKQVNYDPTRGPDAALAAAIQADGNGTGLQWARMLTAGKKVDTAGANGTAVDDTAVSTAFGLSAYLHVFALTGTNVVVKLQDSADNSSFSDITGAAFASATSAPGAQRLVTANNATIRRYVRAVSSGTFSSATFAVAYMRALTATVL